MKAIKTLLAVSVLTAAASSNALVVNLAGTLDSQTLPPGFGTQTLSGNLNFSGAIDVDFSTGMMTAFSLTTDGAYTSTSSLGPAITFYANSTWTASLGSGIAFSSFAPTATGYQVVYSWGAASPNDNNQAGSFSAATPRTCNGHMFCSFAMAGNPAWDQATLTIDLDAALAVSSVKLATVEYGTTVATSNYTLAEEVPLPAAAWLFGSGLIGLAGAVRRRRAAA